MPRASQHIHLLLAAAIASVALAACQPAPLGSLTVKPKAAGKNGAAVAPVAPQLAPLPRVQQPTLVSSSGGASLDGEVVFEAVDDTYFGNSAAEYRLLAMPAQNAMITLSTLDESLFARNGAAIVKGTDADGRFSVSALAPTGRNYVVNANLVQTHRLSALVPAGATSVKLDEASTMIAELARWQLRDQPLTDGDPDEKTFQDMTASDVEALYAPTLALLNAGDFATPENGSLPRIEALQAGAGHLMRNLYVAAFGSRASADLTSTAGPDAISDAWKALFGFRPLALTIIAGNGTRGYDQSDDKPATEVPFAATADTVADHLGNLYVTEVDGHRIRYIPATDQPGPLLKRTTAMTAGRNYTIAGLVSPQTLTAYNTSVRTKEAASVADPLQAPLVSAGSTTLLTPYKLMLERIGATASSHLYFTCYGAHRVMLIPQADFSRYGRSFKAGRLYTLAGWGATGDAEFTGTTQIEADDAGTPYNEQRFEYKLGEGGPAHQANLNSPTGLAKDANHNLYVIDSIARPGKDLAADDPTATYSENYTAAGAPAGRKLPYYHASLRMVRAADGKIFTLRLTLDGEPIELSGANDLRYVQDGATHYLYIAHTRRHVVLRVALPADLTTLDTVIPPALAAEVVLGAWNKPGFIDTDQTGVTYPDFADLSDGIPESQALLNGPMSLDFDADGNLVVVDAARIRLLERSGLEGDGKVYTIAGGVDTRYLAGDARLAYLPGSVFLNFDPMTKTFLLSDRRENLVRRLWTQRGSL